MQPGEHRIYSPTGGSAQVVNSNWVLNLKPGWDIGGGITMNQFPQAAGPSRKIFFRADDILEPSLNLFPQEFIDKLIDFVPTNGQHNTALGYSTWSGAPMKTDLAVMNLKGIRGQHDLGENTFGSVNASLPKDGVWKSGLYAASLPRSGDNEVNVSSVIGFNRKRPFVMFGFDMGTEKNDRAGLFAGNA